MSYAAKSATELPEVLDTKDAAKALKLCTKTVGRLAESGKLRGRRTAGPGSPWRFHRSAIVEFLRGKEESHGDSAA
jgi:excisionase family DNA binding protein